MLALRAGVPSMLKKMPLPPERKDELAEDFRRNEPQDMRLGLQAYLRWLHRDDDPARRLCESKVPAWVVHAEKGDGGLTAHEREVLEACPQVQVVTIPGNVFLLPNETPREMAEVVAEALRAA
jgi:pimeloyl-ACP methyl ester carboxylesterase